MKRSFLVLVLFYPVFGFTQPVKFDTTKYSIHLPDYWKPGNKVWRILDDKLPTVSDELKNKQLCGDNCQPKYTIEFEMSEPEIVDYLTNHTSTGTTTDTWEFVTLYAFSSSLLLFNEKDELITRFILVDKNEIWRVVHKETLRSYAPAPPQKIYAVRDPVSWPVQSTAGLGQSPYTYILNNKDKLSPTRRDMLNIIDEKIRSW